MVLHMPCNLTTSLKNKFIMDEASSDLWRAIKYAIFENLSTMTKMQSSLVLVLGVGFYSNL
jgi:hypothetical protein